MPSNKLEQAAIAARNGLIATNTYNNDATANNYTATHTRAIADTLTPVQGKGTGVFLDTYNGGGDLDVNGNPNAAGSGRLAAYANNLATWGYGPSSYYQQPDMSGNIGQVVLP